MNKFDVAVIGAGPGGLTAAIYAQRSGLNVVIIENNVIGGQASLSYEINNYPGFNSISGTDLTMKMHEQATTLGAVTLYGDIKKIDFAPMNNFIVVEDKEIIVSKVIEYVKDLVQRKKCSTFDIPLNYPINEMPMY